MRDSTLAELAAAHGIALPPPGTASRNFRDFRAFADHNALVRECLRRPSDFRRVAREFCEDEAANGVRYVEVTFTAAAHGERLGDPAMPLEAVLDGLEEGCRATGLLAAVVIDHSRRRSVERARSSVALARRFAHRGVVAFGVAGEESHPLAPFAGVVAEAREAGLHLVHHAGEAEGADSIREAITVGATERLGHGIRVLDDPRLLDEVRERGIALEVCPSSNVALGLVPSFDEHPLPRLRDSGLDVTLNTDIPSVVGTTVVEEYRRVRDRFAYGDGDLADIARTSVLASFAPDHVKAATIDDIAAWSSGPDRP